MSTLWPLAVSFALLFIAPLYSVLRGGSYWAASAAYLSPVLTISFLVFISTCTKILSFFKCDEFADTGDRFLEKVSQTRPETNEGHLALGPRKMLMNIIALILNPRLIIHNSFHLMKTYHRRRIVNAKRKPVPPLPSLPTPRITRWTVTVIVTRTWCCSEP